MQAASNKPYDHLFKLLLIGDSGVGKSSLLLRFTDDEFDEEHPCTIGVDFKVKMLRLRDKLLNLTIWDTAGQEKFRSLTSSYYRGTQGIILVYDVTSRKSFEHLVDWLNEVEMYCNKEDVVKLLVANKTDKRGREVTREEGTAFAKSRAMVYIECSAKTKLGVQQAFEELVTKILETPSLYQDEDENKGTVGVGGDKGNQEAGCGQYCLI
ncbi:Rab subfamily of small GTPases [Balamuthia mandrillaris]